MQLTRGYLRLVLFLLVGFAPPTTQIMKQIQLVSKYLERSIRILCQQIKMEINVLQTLVSSKVFCILQVSFTLFVRYGKEETEEEELVITIQGLIKTKF